MVEATEFLSVEAASDWVRPRVSAKRFQHIVGVASTAKDLAKRSGCDQHLAELAGWLHDACKEVNDKELIRLAKQFALVLHPLEEKNGHLLHGPVAAEVVKGELGLTNEDLLNAIREHTLGAVPMSPLSKVVFLADALEPGRAPEFTQPIWQALNSGANAGPEEQLLDLDAAIAVVCDLTIGHLLETARLIHPRMVEVRNFYLEGSRMNNHSR